MPVVSEELVYLELQKSASTLIGSILIQLFGAKKRPPTHGLLPEDCRSKFVVGSVRNPWSYYVSLWSFGCEGNGGMLRRSTQREFRAAARQLPALRPLLHEVIKPASAWRSVYAEPHSPEQFRQWLARLHDPDRSSEFEAPYAASRFRQFAGYATYRYCRLYADDVDTVKAASTPDQLVRALEAGFLPDAMIRTERVGDDLLAAVRKAGYVVDDVLEKEVRERTAKPVNSSDHLPYTAYYDDASVDLVAERDALIVSRHGYAFGA